MTVQPVAVIVLIVFALYEMALALCCLCRYPKCCVPAMTLLLSAPLQVLSALYTGRLLTAWHTPSSFDPLADGFDLLFQEVALTGGLVLLPVGLGAWMAVQLLFGRSIKDITEPIAVADKPRE